MSDTPPQLTVYHQGNAQVNAGGFNTFVQQCQNLAQLRTFIGAANMVVDVQGQTDPGDGGGGSFYWTPTGTYVDNNESVIVPVGTSQGAWLLISIGNAANITYTPPWPNSYPMTQFQYDRQRISVVDFMTTAQKNDFFANTLSVDQAPAFNNWITYLFSQGYGGLGNIGLSFQGVAPPGAYRIMTPINVAYNVDLSGYGAELVGPITGAPFISNGSTPVVPISSDYAGQVAGACFTDSQLGAADIRYLRISGFTVTNFRYGMVPTLQWTNCTMRDVSFQGCNIGIFPYQAMQYVTFEDCYYLECNVGFVGAATCFASDNPIVSPISYIDGCKFLGVGFGQNVCMANPTFDEWFQQSIMRPSTASRIALGGFSTYPYAAFSTAVNVTGRVIYIGGRNGYINNYLRIGPIENLQGARGVAFIGPQSTGEIFDVSGENCFADSVINASPFTESTIVLAGCTEFQLENVDSAGILAGTLFATGGASVVQSLDAGFSNNIAINVYNSTTAGPTFINPQNFAVKINCEQPGTSVAAVQGNVVRRDSAFLTSAFTGSAALVVELAGINGQDADFFTGSTIDEQYLAAKLPTTGVETSVQWRLGSGLQTNTIVGLQGKLEIYLRRQDTGAQDYGAFLVTFGSEGILGTTLNGGASSGQPDIVVTGRPIGSFVSGENVTVGSDPYLVKSVNASTNTVTMCSNLVNSYSSGANVTPTQAIDATLVAFANGWVTGPSFAGSALAVASTLGTGITLEVRAKMTLHGVSM